MAHNWLHKLGYEYMGPAQAAYKDGHEQPDVKSCWKEVLDVFKALESFMYGSVRRGEDDTHTPEAASWTKAAYHHQSWKVYPTSMI